MKKIFKKFAVPTFIFLFVMFGGGIISPLQVSASDQNPTGPCTYGYGGGPAQNAPCKGTALLDKGEDVQKNDANNPGFWDRVLKNFFATIVFLILKFVALLTNLC